MDIKKMFPFLNIAVGAAILKSGKYLALQCNEILLNMLNPTLQPYLVETYGSLSGSSELYIFTQDNVFKVYNKNLQGGKPLWVIKDKNKKYPEKELNAHETDFAHFKKDNLFFYGKDPQNPSSDTYVMDKIRKIILITGYVLTSEEAKNCEEIQIDKEFESQ